MLGDANHGITGEDVKPNVYEGGLKTWECAEDLATYLASMPLPFLRQPLEATIIEVGSLLHSMAFEGNRNSKVFEI